MSKNQTMNRNYVPRIQRSVYFDGDDDYLICTDHDDFSFTTGSGTELDMPFTISLWFKAENTQSQIGLVSKAKSTSGHHEYRMFMASGKVYFDINTNSASHYKRCYTTDAITYANTWTHVAFTFNGDSTTANSDQQKYGMKIYVNGVHQDLSTASGGSYTGMNNETSDLTFGFLLSDVNYDLKGWMADIILWKNFELDADHIRHFYAAQPGGINYSVNPMISGLGGIYPIVAAEACKLWIPCSDVQTLVDAVDEVPATPGYTYQCGTADRPPDAPGPVYDGGEEGSVEIVPPSDPEYEEHCAECGEEEVCYKLYWPDLGGTYQPAVDAVLGTSDLEITPNTHNATFINQTVLSAVAASNSPTQLTLPNS